MAKKSDSKLKKGLPKRYGNAHLKAYRAECWARGEARKQARREAERHAEAANRAAGTTRWQVAQNARQARRHPAA